MSVASQDWAQGLPFMAGPYFVGLYQPSPETTFYWEGVAARELRLRRCPECGANHHPKRIVCSACSHTALDWKASPGDGEVYSFSEVHRVADPAFASSTPYILGVVRLDESVCLFTRFISEDAPIRVGTRVRLDFRVLEQGQLMPVFVA